MRYVFILFITIYSLLSCAQIRGEALVPVTDTLRYPLGSDTIVFTRSVYGAAQPYLFLQVHDSEATAEAAARQYLERAGGVLLSIENGGARNITFGLQGQTFTFDPNRMFTPAGLQATLQRLSQSTPEAIAAVEGLATWLLQQLPDSTLIIAVHNNTNDAFSVTSYTSDTVYRKDATAVKTNSAHDVDDFFFTTGLDIYEILAPLNYNVVLQDNEGATDDGSLSVYAGRTGMRYVNVEAEHGRQAFQVQMITDLLLALKEGGYTLTD